MTLYQPYLAHHGVLGMKWGVRKKQDRSLGNRAYAKQQDKLSKQNWKATKAKVKSGELSKTSSAYKRARGIRRRYQIQSAIQKMSMTPGERGKYMRRIGMDATRGRKRGVSYKTVRNASKQAKAMSRLKRASAVYVASVIGSKAVYAGISYLNNRRSPGSSQRLLDTNFFELDPKKYSWA